MHEVLFLINLFRLTFTFLYYLPKTSLAVNSCKDINLLRIFRFNYSLPEVILSTPKLNLILSGNKAADWFGMEKRFTVIKHKNIDSANVTRVSDLIERMNHLISFSFHQKYDS